MTLLVVTTSCEGLWGKEKDVKRGYLVARPLDLLAKVVGLKHFKRLNSALYSIYIYRLHFSTVLCGVLIT